MRLGARRVCVLGGALLGAPGVAAAQQREPLVVDDAAQIGCASNAELRSRIEERLGRPLTPPGSASGVYAEVRRSRDRAGWHAHIALVATRDKQALGERVIHARGADCTELDASLVLALALMFDAVPAGPSSGTTEDQPAEANPPPAVTSRPMTQPPAEGARAPSASWQLGVGPMAAASFGFLPGLGWGVGAAAHLESRNFGFGMEVLVWPHATSGDADQGGRYWAWTARPLGCLRLVRRGPWIAACAALSAGSVSARGFGFSENTAPNRFVLNPGLEVRAGMTLGPSWAAYAGLGVQTPIFRHRFTVRAPDGAERENYIMSPVAALALAGLDFVGW